MITSIIGAYEEFYFYTNLNPFEENRGEEEQVDYDRLYNQKHIIEREDRHDDDNNKKKKYDLESVDENDLYHYHFGDYYESMNDEELHNNKEIIDCIQKEMNTFIFEDETKEENRKRLYESDDDDSDRDDNDNVNNNNNDNDDNDFSDSDSDNNEEDENAFTQFGDIFTFTLRVNPETKEKCFDTIKYFLYSFLYH